MAQAYAALEGAISIAAFGAIKLCFGLALAVTLKGDGDREGVLEAHRFDDKGFLFFGWATTSTGLHAERDLPKSTAV